MARARRKQEPSVFAGSSDGRTSARVLPDLCPVCGQRFRTGDLDMSAEMPAHLNSHAPVEICQRCEVKEKGWRLDWDLVKYPRPDMSLFFCSGCGRYATLAAAAPNTPHLEA